MSAVTVPARDSAGGGLAARVDVAPGAADGTRLAAARADQDGRGPGFGPQTLDSGDDRSSLRTDFPVATRGHAPLRRPVTVELTVQPPEQHDRAPLVPSPFVRSAYRGS